MVVMLLRRYQPVAAGGFDRERPALQPLGEGTLQGDVVTCP